MFDSVRRLLRRAYLTLRKYVRRRKETEVPPSSVRPVARATPREVHHEIISSSDIRKPNQARGLESRPVHHKLSHWQIQRRIKNGRRKRRRLKPSSKHFPSVPAFEKRHWDKEKKMEDD